MRDVWRLDLFLCDQGTLKVCIIVNKNRQIDNETPELLPAVRLGIAERTFWVAADQRFLSRDGPGSPPSNQQQMLLVEMFLIDRCLNIHHCVLVPIRSSRISICRASGQLCWLAAGSSQQWKEVRTGSQSWYL